MRLICLFAALMVFIPIEAYAHSGGLNSAGCHNERRTGGYHCHRGSYTPPRVVTPQRAYTQPRLYNPPPQPDPRIQVQVGSFPSSERDKLLKKIALLENQVAILKAQSQQLAVKPVNRNAVKSNECQIKINSLKKYYEGRLKGQSHNRQVRQPQRRNNQVVNLRNLHPTERTNVRVACVSSSGAATYNRCIQHQINLLKGAPRLADTGIDRLHPTERTNVRVACVSSNGAANYNRCILHQITQLQNAPRLVE